MGIQSVVLEDHSDVPVLGSHVVDQTVADVQLALGDFLQTGYHTQGGGLSAAGGADQHDKFLVLDLQVEVMDGYDALIGHGQLGLTFLRRLVVLFLLFLFLVVIATERVNFLDSF